MAASPFCYPAEVKIEKLCRTCLCKDGELNSIFEVHRGVETLDYIITTVTGVKVRAHCVTKICTDSLDKTCYAECVQIQPNDHLPKSVCHDCKKKATSAFDFKKKAQESDISLQKLVKTENFQVELEIKSIVPTKDIKIEQTTKVDFDMGNMDMDYGSFSGLDDEDRDPDTVKMESHGDMFPLYCDICSSYFDSEESLRNHLKNSCLKVECNGESGSYCPLCGTCYSTTHSLAKHMSEKHSELMLPTQGRARQTNNILSKLSENGFRIKTVNLQKYNCVFCKKQFKKKDELSDHTMVHKDAKVYSCVLCKKMFVKKSQFEKHSCLRENNVKNEKNEDESSTDVTAESKVMSLLHEMTLQNVVGRSDYTGNIMMPNVCALCSEIFITTSDLFNHIDNLHPEKSQRCNICLKVFASLKSAARHRKICKNIERKFHCSVCGLKFAHEISLNKHILSNHEGESVSVDFMNSNQKVERKFQCDTCNKCFFRKEKLERHTKTHMPSEKIFECDICLRKFNRKDNMKSHKKTHEPRTDVKPNTCLCLYCGRSFNNSSNLIVHMRRHTGEKPYKCDFCGKGFPRSSDLQSHRRSHTGEKPWECKVCGKAFSRSNKLSRHMRIHTGLRPYKCTYCDKAFTQSNDLTLHIRRHTGDKPYICDVCGDRFIQGTALQNHRRAHGHFPSTTTETPQPERPILLRITSDENGILTLKSA